MPLPSHNYPRLLIANRGEIAIRIARAAYELGIHTLSVYSEDDAHSLHIRKSDEAIPLKGKGVAAYLDAAQLIHIAQANNCQLIHPAYGFLSENAPFAQACAEAKLTFVGPSADILALLGDKIRARKFAEKAGVAIIPGTSQPTSLEEAASFFEAFGATSGIMIKAMTGGGGRGMRKVRSLSILADAYLRCQSEAQKAFGRSELYVEKLLADAKHIEIQIIGDGTGVVSHLWERECSTQRRHQKLIEIAPCPSLPETLRNKMIKAAICLAERIQYESLGTFEFLVEGTDLTDDPPFFFIEANPRLQVEHTVTEEVTGIDLVKSQLQLALGHSLQQLNLTQDHIPKPKGYSMQLRINMERIGADGQLGLGTGTLSAFELPLGPGIRIDTAGYVGYHNNLHFDSLLAKLIVSDRSGNFPALVSKSYRALCECKIAGIPNNITFLQQILQLPEFQAGNISTRFIDEHLAQIINQAETNHQRLFFEKTEVIDEPQAALIEIPAGLEAIHAPMPGSILSIDVQAGDQVQKGQQLMIIEAMKMENVIATHLSGIVKEVSVKAGDILLEHQLLFLIEAAGSQKSEQVKKEAIDLDEIRPDLAKMLDRRALGLDEARPQAVEKRRSRAQRTARENIADLCDEGTFTEFGAFTIAAQRRRRSIDDLIRNTPADGFITGIAEINGHHFGETQARCMVLAYDFTVLAGTQGSMNHKKLDRMLGLAKDWELPIVLFAEGGGGRPGDIDQMTVAGLDVMSFFKFAQLSGQVPLINIVSRYCFAGNAALLGCSDVIIATENASIGMGGPAMIEGGGLGVFHPAEVGPVSFQSTNGVIDVLVKDEAAAVATAKKYLSYFQGAISEWACEDQRLLRRLIPENRRRAYDIRLLIHTLADKDAVLELRQGFGIGMITALIRIEGRPLGLIANNPKHLAGAIDSDGADKAARFMQLCEAFGIPLLSLCDTPGIMVGPEAEKTGTVRHAARMFVTAASLHIPFFTIVLRKGYGLGAQAMAGGSFRASFFTVAWPTGEFGAMGLEGAVRLGYKKELAQAGSPEEQQALYDKMVAQAYENGKALNMASFLEIDEVIDPVDSRRWVVSALKASSKKQTSDRKKRPYIDPW